jgi:hypothetical protein
MYLLHHSMRGTDLAMQVSFNSPSAEQPYTPIHDGPLNHNNHHSTTTPPSITPSAIPNDYHRLAHVIQEVPRLSLAEYRYCATLLQDKIVVDTNVTATPSIETVDVPSYPSLVRPPSSKPTPSEIVGRYLSSPITPLPTPPSHTTTTITPKRSLDDDGNHYTEDRPRKRLHIEPSHPYYKSATPNPPARRSALSSYTPPLAMSETTRRILRGIDTIYSPPEKPSYVPPSSSLSNVAKRRLYHAPKDTKPVKINKEVPVYSPPQDVEYTSRPTANGNDMEKKRDILKQVSVRSFYK